MNLSEAKAEFVRAWGQFGTEWGINRTMARIHALLLASPAPLDTDRVMGELGVSRGHANTNLRGLVDWGVVRKVQRPGVRKDLYEAEKDMWEVARRVAERRRSRELDPILRAVSRLAVAEPGRGEDPGEARAFRRLMKDIGRVGKDAGRLLGLVTALDRGGFFGRLLRLGR
ncbi:MAG: transcriptional regulator [Planctomycetota bacterium]